MSTLNLSDEAFSHEFPDSMGRPANAALVFNGIKTLEQVSKLTEKQLLEIHGVGPKAVKILQEELRKKRLTLQSEAR